ncbi:PQQ-binding-like beta-propeller repeat protein [Hyphomicrobium sp. D-2]|uniref:outer membrane protein assembly factor BamB family protein n=1 Tax=Hyphomicrobium sp. D-2 TaxID=3041621 RepID=UPI002459063D|nr:PQQ-binding-like beta-propeller repeat protein [Hyphomicrobium sp. D-2]MDH4980925.1 PQQ-binding-like beta-propeller repeat protein [Hyphomicrobium sp. D-2]
MRERRTSSERSGACVAVGHAGSVMLLEIASGRLVWERALAEFPAGLPCEGQPVSVRLVEGTVIAASMGHVFALSAEDGELLWQVNRRGRGSGETSLAISHD